jgi:hypothetical protein
MLATAPAGTRPVIRLTQAVGADDADNIALKREAPKLRFRKPRNRNGIRPNRIGGGVAKSGTGQMEDDCEMVDPNYN